MRPSARAQHDGVSRRRFLRLCVAGAPIVAGGALIARGGWTVADAWCSVRQGDVFRHLPEIRLGDVVAVQLGGGVSRYRVTDKIVITPDATWVMEPTTAPIATLITCVPDGVYSHRLVVVSELMGA